MYWHRILALTVAKLNMSEHMSRLDKLRDRLEHVAGKNTLWTIKHVHCPEFIKHED
jgi:hypothetical protein